MPQPEHRDGACHGRPENTFSILSAPDLRQNLIVEKRTLNEAIRLFRFYCPAIALYCRPGQFLIVRGDERGERIPLTIADFDREDGSVTVVVQLVGLGCHKLDDLEEGDRFLDVVGPLGHPSEIENFGSVVCIGGGLGVAPVFPIQRALKDAGNTVISIMGVRSEDFLFWEEHMRGCSDELFVTTDDGSCGEKGFVTTALQRLIDQGRALDRVIAIGPPVMMRAVCETTRPHGIPTIVSLNSIMVDGTGMCGGCRVEVGGETKFTCVDGPEFDGHLVDFPLLLSRLRTYEEHEGSVFSQHIDAEHAERPRAAQRVAMPTQDPMARRANFDEVALGYTADMAQEEASRCIQCKKPRCVEGCPVNVDIPGFIAEIQAGRFLAAARKLKETNNLPGVCGRVCPQETQCEVQCVLGKKSQPVAIGRLERFAADSEAVLSGERTPLLPAPSGKNVAVVGSGPAGLTAAADLALAGHAVTVFEALHAPGGVLTYGIPEFRLPKAIVRRECEYLERLGVRFRMNMPIGQTVSAPQLLEQGFDVVFLGTGAGLPWFLNIPGENLNGVYSSNEFLTRIN